MENPIKLVFFKKILKQSSLKYYDWDFSGGSHILMYFRCGIEYRKCNYIYIYIMICEPASQTCPSTKPSNCAIPQELEAFTIIVIKKDKSFVFPINICQPISACELDNNLGLFLQSLQEKFTIYLRK